MNESITKNLFLATRDRAAEVALRKELQEKERQLKLDAKRKEQEERLRRISEHKNQLILQRAREKAERELQKSKAVIDRRLAHLEQEKVRKEEILQKAHSATSRTSNTSTKKIFAFGSSTPRELSYLEKLSKDQKQYDRRLAPSTPSSGASPSITPPRDSDTRNSSVTRGPKVMLGSNMTSSLYVPQKAKPAAPRASPPKRISPAKVAPVAKANPMTQSMYVPKKTSSPAHTKQPIKARNASPSKPMATKRSPATSISQSPAQRKPPIPRANHTPAAARPPPRAQPVEKTEAPKPKAIVPRKIQKSEAPAEPTVTPVIVAAAPIIVAAEQLQAPKEGEVSPPPTPINPKDVEKEHKIEPEEIVDGIEHQFHVDHNEKHISLEQIVDLETPKVEKDKEQKVIPNPTEPKSLQDELMEANGNEKIDFGDEENQILIGNDPSHDNAPNQIVEETEAKQPLLQSEEAKVDESVDDHYRQIESDLAHKTHQEEAQHQQYTTQNGHDTNDSHNTSYSIDDAISGLATLQLHTPQKDANIVVEQNFVDFGAETPVAEPQPLKFDQEQSSVNVETLDLSPLRSNDDGFSGSEEKLQQENGKETSRTYSPDHGPFSSSSSNKESDAENADIIRGPEVKKVVVERKSRLSEILAKARQGMSTSPPKGDAEDGNNQSVDAKLLALKLIEQRRQEKLSTGIENDSTTISSENLSETESIVTANNTSPKNGNANGNGPRYSLAEELAVANPQQTAKPPMDHLPGQPIYDSDYHVVMNGKTTPPEDPAHVQLV
jgi:hypothetical protein